MKLRVLLPTHVLLEADVIKIIAEAGNGHFCLLPRHVDFVAELVPGLLSFERVDGGEEFLAVDRGVLVKCAGDVLVSARLAVAGAPLGALRRTVEEEFEHVDEHERQARSAVAKLEAYFVRRFLELEHLKARS